jgi:hypothetical protein
MITPASTLGPEAPPNDPEAAYRFACRVAIENNRDHWGRPKVMLPDGSREAGYRRASSYGAPLEDDSNLIKWKLRQVERGIARRPDLALAVTRAEIGLDGPAEARKAAKKELNELAEKAMDVVESSAKASIGTSLHHVFEEIDLGRDPGHVPEQWRPDVAAYQLLAQDFRVLSVERFVVQDGHQVGGTLDRAVEVLVPVTAADGTVLPAGSVIIGDVKTSQSMDFAGCKFGVQCWAYATGVPYDPIKKQRVDWGHAAPRTDWAVIFHVGSGTGQAQLHWVNLTEAAEAADDARRVYQWRNKRGKSLITKGTVAEDFTVTCEVSESVFDLTMAYQRAVAAGQWNEVLKARFGKRKRELEPAAVTP